MTQPNTHTHTHTHARTHKNTQTMIETTREACTALTVIEAARAAVEHES